MTEWKNVALTVLVYGIVIALAYISRPEPKGTDEENNNP